ncbi:MAG: zinc-binding dehydrogenase [candidate division Zixibacteria bacterium]|nr:zinc-binding dehydrogenase [candidate division Zixibacteria bacterium]
MKIAVLHGPRDLRIEEHPLETSLQPHQIRVETRISALKIGTDRGNYEGAERVPGAPDYPRWVGDSNLGVVRETGTAVTRFKPGDRVISRYPHQSEYVADEHEIIVTVPDGVENEDAVWGHLYTLSAICYRKALFQPGENVAVVGLGVLGLGAVALGPCFGGRVAAIGNSPLRTEMALRMGAHITGLSDDPGLPALLEDFTQGQGIDLVILTANPWPALRTACRIVRENGRVAIVSLPGRGEPALDFNPLSMEWFYLKGISLIAVNGQCPALYPAIRGDRFSWENMCRHTLSLMADGRLEPKRLITHRMHYSQIAEAYEMIYRREKNMLGVIFNWQE